MAESRDHITDKGKKLDEGNYVLDDPLAIAARQIAERDKANQSKSLLDRTVEFFYDAEKPKLDALKQVGLKAYDANQRGDKAAFEALKPELKKALEDDKKAATHQTEVNFYAGSFAKAVPLFAGSRSKMLLAASVGVNALDQVKSNDDAGSAALHAAMGGLKGFALKKTFDHLAPKTFFGAGKTATASLEYGNVATKGLALGGLSRLYETGLSSSTYIDKETGQVSLAKGVKETFATTLNPGAMALDAALFMGAHGAFKQVAKAGERAVESSPTLSALASSKVGTFLKEGQVLSNTGMGATFGLATGSSQELIRQYKSGEAIDPYEIMRRGALQAITDGLAGTTGSSMVHGGKLLQSRLSEGQPTIPARAFAGDEAPLVDKASDKPADAPKDNAAAAAEPGAVKDGDAALRSSDGQTRPADAETRTSDGRTRPADAEARPADAETRPADAETRPADAETRPADAETRPADAEARPADAETRPADAETRPADAETRPADAETRPVDAENLREAAKPADVQTSMEVSLDLGTLPKLSSQEVAARGLDREGLSPAIEGLGDLAQARTAKFVEVNEPAKYARKASYEMTEAQRPVFEEGIKLIQGVFNAHSNPKDVVRFLEYGAGRGQEVKAQFEQMAKDYKDLGNVQVQKLIEVAMKATPESVAVAERGFDLADRASRPGVETFGQEYRDLVEFAWGAGRDAQGTVRITSELLGHPGMNRLLGEVYAGSNGLTREVADRRPVDWGDTPPAARDLLRQIIGHRPRNADEHIILKEGIHIWADRFPQHVGVLHQFARVSANGDIAAMIDSRLGTDYFSRFRDSHITELPDAPDAARAAGPEPVAEGDNVQPKPVETKEAEGPAVVHEPGKVTVYPERLYADFEGASGAAKQARAHLLSDHIGSMSDAQFINWLKYLHSPVERPGAPAGLSNLNAMGMSRSAVLSRPEVVALVTDPASAPVDVATIRNFLAAPAKSQSGSMPVELSDYLGYRLEASMQKQIAENALQGNADAPVDGGRVLREALPQWYLRQLRDTYSTRNAEGGYDYPADFNPNLMRWLEYGRQLDRQNPKYRESEPRTSSVADRFTALDQALALRTPENAALVDRLLQLGAADQFALKNMLAKLDPATNAPEHAELLGILAARAQNMGDLKVVTEAVNSAKKADQDAFKARKDGRDTKQAESQREANEALALSTLSRVVQPGTPEYARAQQIITDVVSGRIRDPRPDDQNRGGGRGGPGGPRFGGSDRPGSGRPGSDRSGSDRSGSDRQGGQRFDRGQQRVVTDRSAAEPSAESAAPKSVTFNDALPVEPAQVRAVDAPADQQQRQPVQEAPPADQQQRQPVQEAPPADQQQRQPVQEAPPADQQQRQPGQDIDTEQPSRVDRFRQRYEKKRGDDSDGDGDGDGGGRKKDSPRRAARQERRFGSFEELANNWNRDR
ncbi:MAG: hypothetical protein K2Y32_01710 [Candidatus Obscuribacterales bacterium]|nr:hypothetical protein [Candidatus Obscuribacterales bacterium]